MSASNRRIQFVTVTDKTAHNVHLAPVAYTVSVDHSTVTRWRSRGGVYIEVTLILYQFILNGLYTVYYTAPPTGIRCICCIPLQRPEQISEICYTAAIQQHYNLHTASAYCSNVG